MLRISGYLSLKLIPAQPSEILQKKKIQTDQVVLNRVTRKQAFFLLPVYGTPVCITSTSNFLLVVSDLTSHDNRRKPLHLAKASKDPPLLYLQAFQKMYHFYHWQAQPTVRSQAYKYRAT